MDLIMQQLGIQIDYTRELLIVGLILARTMPMIVMTPFLGGEIIPGTVKMGIGGMLTIMVWPLARGAVDSSVPFAALPFTFLMMKEAFIGFAMGYISSHMFWAMEIAGRIIDTARGTAMSEISDPHTKHRITISGNFYLQLFLVFFVMSGGHILFLDTFFSSFQKIPINTYIGVDDGFSTLFHFMVRTTSEVLVIGTLLAAPVLAATFVTDVVFGILNRVAPQLNAYFMAMPIKAIGGILVMLIGMGALIERFSVDSVWMLQLSQKLVDILAH